MGGDRRTRTDRDADPLHAALDALALFPADAIVVATRPQPQSHRLARGVVDRLCERSVLPVLHVGTDLPRELLRFG